ncbi:EAL domain-containing protein [Methylophilus sp.]|uniref:bifunctional diguanylate cyclase/phosphodiesterase n=1 Tax=Methylophilus sp. TaxID=29541 RepID=UPI002579ACA2|nr:EAL domain-containing protein [Methylophilus sp.]
MAADDRKFITLTDYLHEPVIHYDRDCKRTYLNPAAIKLIGEPAKDLEGKTPSSLRPSSLALQHYQEKIRSVIETGLDIEFDFFLDRLPDGPNVHTKVLRIRAVPELDSDGTVVGVLAIAHDITALKLSEKRLRALIENHPDHITRFDQHARYSYVSPSFTALSGIEESTLLGKTLLECEQIATAAEREKIHHAILQTLAHETSCTVESHWPHDRVIELRLVQEKDAIGEISGVLCILRDITQQKHSEKTLLTLNRSLRLLSSCNQTLIHAENEQQLLNDVCQLVIESGGYPLAWVGYPDHGSYQPLRIAAIAGEGLTNSTTVALEQKTPEISLAVKAFQSGRVEIIQDYPNAALLNNLGEMASREGLLSCIALPLKVTKKTIGVITIYASRTHAFSNEEVTLLDELANDLAFGIQSLRIRAEHREAETKLEYLAHHDPLTGLPNRLLLRKSFEQCIHQANKRDYGLAMLFLDMDNFKEINDSFGHAIGDALLIAVVRRLKSILSDACILSREGGDEFVLLINNTQASDIPTQTAQQILNAMQEPFEVSGNTLHASFSIGISLYPNDGKDFETLRKNADAALYLAKDCGRNTYRFFVSQMNADAQKRMRIQTDLHTALKNNEFLLHYQPQIRLCDGRISGIEALIRWQNADGQMLPPCEFIPIAEQSGLIIQMGEWVLREACRQLAAWHQQGQTRLVVAVNLSSHQFRHGNIVETISAALHDFGLQPQCLELELTESILIQDTESVISTLHTLKQIGVKLAIDDFGTGYSSLSYLKQLSVDKLKIDKSFIRDLHQDKDSAEIVRAIIQLGHILQLTVVAEGVETQEQLAFLTHCQCDQIQGYLFSRPVAAENILEILARVGMRV